MNAEHEYLHLLKFIKNRGDRKTNRTGIDTIQIFGCHLQHNFIYSGFPLITTKKIHFKSVLHELLWFLKGDTHTKYLKENGVSIWDEWADKDGNLGRTYGAQWRNWNGNIDQVQNVINLIKKDSSSRRLLVSAWNPTDVPSVKVPPCHVMYQFNVHGQFLDIAVVQRSCDFFLGVPFNISSYATLLCMVAKVTNLEPRNMYYTFHDAHIYVNHLEQVEEQLSRKPYKSPRLEIKQRENIDDFVYEDFKLVDYKYHPSIKADVAV